MCCKRESLEGRSVAESGLINFVDFWHLGFSVFAADCLFPPFSLVYAVYLAGYLFPFVKENDFRRGLSLSPHFRHG